MTRGDVVRVRPGWPWYAVLGDALGGVQALEGGLARIQSPEIPLYAKEVRTSDFVLAAERDEAEVRAADRRGSRLLGAFTIR
jgi:hypothetical protein